MTFTPITNTLGTAKRFVLVFAVQAHQIHCLQNGRATCFQFSLIWVTEQKCFQDLEKKNVLTWHFTDCCAPNIQYILLGFTVWAQRGEHIWVCLVCPLVQKQHLSSFSLMFILAEQTSLLSACMIHESHKMTVFSCEWQRLIFIIIECTLQALDRCLFLLPQFCLVYQMIVCRAC